jgi:hypothetical protein
LIVLDNSIIDLFRKNKLKRIRKKRRKKKMKTRAVSTRLMKM